MTVRGVQLFPSPIAIQEAVALPIGEAALPQASSSSSTWLALPISTEGLFTVTQRRKLTKKERKTCHSVPMDYSPTGPTLPTATIATPKVLGPRQIPPIPPQPVRQARNADQSGAMAAQVEKLHQQRERKKGNNTRL